MTYNIRLSNGETKEVENVTDITLDKDGMCRVLVEGVESAYLIFPKSKIELIELIDFWKIMCWYKMKTEKTKEIENYLFLFLQKRGTFCCPEVKMGMGKVGKHGIVDYLSLTARGIVTCYEIKVTKEDLVNSSHGHNFYGNYNFYVIPVGLFQKIKDYVPKYVGVIGFDIEGHAKYLKMAKYLTIRNLSAIKMYLIRSLYREFQKSMKESLNIQNTVKF